MAEWLYEEGIGEARAALIEKGRLVEAQIEREGDGARAVQSCRASSSGRSSPRSAASPG